ncbi:hypothetical protein [Desulfobacter sp.]|uniref:hypothetical protein n=1 Tax=Desulfobacter sp. TaxID=2294 RepID=UPI000E915A9B|nr:hypothetical protein [Desulfobacter sp.]HBT87319.1 hypothetical protein [Desulfobacter sp.]
MSLPTAEEVTNLFLYNNEEKPTNIVDTALIRSESDHHTRSVDANEFMEGPGRFALAAMSNLVKKFFTAADIPGYSYGQSLNLSKVEMAEALGIEGSESNIVFQQYNYDDGQDNYGERVYIWGSSSFKIGDDTRFVIDTDGTRHIENLTIRPFDDDFDFNSENIFTKWANTLLLK